MSDPGGHGAGPIRIACAVDGRMTLGAAVLAQSVAEWATPARPIEMHLMLGPGAEDLADRLAPLAAPAFAVTGHRMGDAGADLAVHDAYTAAIFYRLFLAETLGADGRAIYLDADTLLTADPAPLFDADLDGRAIGVVPDCAMYHVHQFGMIPVGAVRRPASLYFQRVLGVPYRRAEDYFNSGVMVMDLKAWTRREVTTRALSFIRASERLQWPDQDALNVVCRDDRTILDARWNVLAGAMDHESLMAPSARWDAIRTAWRDDPRLIHFSGDTKPWRADHRRTPHDGRWRACRDRLEARLGARFRDGG